VSESGACRFWKVVLRGSARTLKSEFRQHVKQFITGHNQWMWCLRQKISEPSKSAELWWAAANWHYSKVMYSNKLRELCSDALQPVKRTLQWCTATSSAGKAQWYTATGWLNSTVIYSYKMSEQHSDVLVQQQVALTAQWCTATRWANSTVMYSKRVPWQHSDVQQQVALTAQWCTATRWANNTVMYSNRLPWQHSDVQLQDEPQHSDVQQQVEQTANSTVMYTAATI
jgi:hypothetical protein